MKSSTNIYINYFNSKNYPEYAYFKNVTTKAKTIHLRQNLKMSKLNEI